MAIARPNVGNRLDTTVRTVAVAPGGDEQELPKPCFDLEEPGTIQFTAERALRGQALNRFALSLRSQANRQAFLDDPRAYALRYRLADDVLEMLERRDWTGLLLAGGHVQALLKLAATVGEDLWDIGADNVGGERSVLIASCPRVVRAVPGEV